MKLLAILAAVGAVSLGVQAHAASILYGNTFDSENAGMSQLNFTAFDGLTVSKGSVDLVASGDYGISCVSGRCIDLDGSTASAGTIESGFFDFNAGDTIRLSFDISGNQRGGASDQYMAAFTFANPVDLVSFGSTFGAPSPGSPAPGLTSFGSGTQTIAPLQGFASQALYFTALTAGSVKFSIGASGGDYLGPILDNLSLRSEALPVPEPATWAMMLLGFFGVGGAIRSRRQSILGLAA